MELPAAALLVFAGALAGGLVNGLTGFGTGMVTLPIWVHTLAPVLASPLVVICSLVGQFQTLPAIWHAIDVRRLMPFLVGGLLGVPFGAWLLPTIDPGAFRTTIGVLLVAGCGFLLLYRRRSAYTGGGCGADGAVGFAGGILGGLAGLSGLAPTLWAELRGWEKDARRAVFQGYSTTILLFALASQAVAGVFTWELATLVVIALPGTIFGAWAGRRIYARLDTRRFSRLVLAILMVAGIVLVATA